MAVPGEMAPDWVTCGASVTGTDHRRRGLGCDDAYSVGAIGDFVVAAVADGAGSVTGTSAWGAYAACRSVLDDALQSGVMHDFACGETEFADRLIRWLFDRALDRVTRQSEIMGLDLQFLATTLSVAVANRTRAAFGQIGDGVIAAEQGGAIRSILVDAKNDYANVTTFLQSDGALSESLRTTVLGDVTAVALSTDGMRYKITDVATGGAYEPFFRDSWRHVRSGASGAQLAALLAGIEDDQTGDDKTVVLAASRTGGDPSALTMQTPIREHSPPPAAVALAAPDRVDAVEPTVPLPNGRHRARRPMRRRPRS